MPAVEAPPAPPAAPAKAAAPATPSKPASPPINPLSAFDELDKLSFEGEENEKAKADEKKPADKVDSKPDTDSVDVRRDDVQEDKEPTTKTSTKSELDRRAAEPPPTKAKELREAYEATKKERDALKAELEAARKSTPKDDPERSAITERLTKEEKRRQELEEEIKHLNYERSSEYKEQYQEPLNKAYARALKEIKEYVVTEDNGNERAATVDDFAAVMRLGPGEVVAKTKAWFGDAAPEVRAMRRQILELDEKATEAVKSYKEKAVEIDERQTAEQAKTRKKAEELWEKNNKEAIEKYPQFFAPKDGDDEGNKLLESGYALADLHFNPPKDLSMEKRVGLASQVRHRVAGFARVALENKRLQEKLTAAEAELEEFKASEPGKGDGPRSTKPAPKTWADEIDELAK